MAENAEGWLVFSTFGPLWVVHLNPWFRCGGAILLWFTQWVAGWQDRQKIAQTVIQ